MKSRVKWLLVLTLFLISSLLIGCGSWAGSPTEQQIISCVQTYGVPYFPSSYGATPYPVGQWAAVYEGDSNWRIQGGVATTSYENKTRNYSTTWILSDSKLTLLMIDGRIPATDGTGIRDIATGRILKPGEKPTYVGRE